MKGQEVKKLGRMSFGFGVWTGSSTSNDVEKRCRKQGKRRERRSRRRRRRPWKKCKMSCIYPHHDMIGKESIQQPVTSTLDNNSQYGSQQLIVNSYYLSSQSVVGSQQTVDSSQQSVVVTYYLLVYIYQLQKFLESWTLGTEADFGGG